MKEAEVIDALGALAQETRLRIVRQLVLAGGQGVSAGTLAAATKASPSRLSFHLTALSDAGLITSEKMSRHVIYRIRFEALGALLHYIIHDCCNGDARVRDCC